MSVGRKDYNIHDAGGASMLGHFHFCALAEKMWERSDMTFDNSTLVSICTLQLG